MDKIYEAGRMEEKKSMAKKLFALENMSLEAISDITELSLHEIRLLVSE